MSLNHNYPELGLYLLRREERYLNFSSKECGSYLLTVVRQNQQAVIRYLLDKGVNINHQDDYG